MEQYSHKNFVIESTEERFSRMMMLPDEAIDLAEAALVIAGTEYPEIEVDKYLHQLEFYTQEIRSRLNEDFSPENIIFNINEYLFDEQGFDGNVDDYYDPKNTFLNDLLERKLGVPISMSLLYMELGQRLGLPLQGVAFPGHFLVKFAMDGKDVVIDPFLRGTALSRDDLDARLDELYGDDEKSRPPLGKLLNPARNKDVLVRMLRNLKAIYFQSEDYEKALMISRLIFLATPNTPVEIRDRGTIFLHMECKVGALLDYKKYLELDPEADDAEDIRFHIIELNREVAMLN